MDEARLKVAILTHLRKVTKRLHEPIVTAEFSLGSSGVRADLAAFRRKTVGFEIKTEKDTLRRLSSQMRAYSRYFHEVVAVIAPTHLRHLSLDDLHGASLWSYNQRGVFSRLKSGTSNRVEPLAMNDILTQKERRGGNFRSAIEARYDKTSYQFWQAVAGRPIQTCDLTLLSRFAESRTQAQVAAKEREAQWLEWLAAQGCSPYPSQSSSVSSADLGSL